MSDRPAAAGPHILVIGYGSTLRGDDGVGPRMAEAVAAWNLPHVRAFSVHQLAPEMAHDVSAADLAIFADARRASAEETATIRPLAPADSVPALGHIGDPRALLALTRALYAKCPPAWWITVPGTNFELGDGLSARSEAEMNAVLGRIARFCRTDFNPFPGSENSVAAELFLKKR